MRNNVCELITGVREDNKLICICVFLFGIPLKGAIVEQHR
ncbi:hypothetical protein bmyco0003_48970 [Bacillus pseudomycoides]|nr:hypothetical protein bmyco0002_52870 [Bacillus pseudomycoides]EEM08417.1 hypothetical protein bmyco0003_48970 [Bacillus pseudomycoides]